MKIKLKKNIKKKLGPDIFEDKHTGEYNIYSYLNILSILSTSVLILLHNQTEI